MSAIPTAANPAIQPPPPGGGNPPKPAQPSTISTFLKSAGAVSYDYAVHGINALAGLVAFEAVCKGCNKAGGVVAGQLPLVVNNWFAFIKNHTPSLIGRVACSHSDLSAKELCVAFVTLAAIGTAGQEAKRCYEIKKQGVAPDSATQHALLARPFIALYNHFKG